MKRFHLCLVLSLLGCFRSGAEDLENIFANPPSEARPWVYWFWMGSTITADGISGDLEALRDAGFGGPLRAFPDWLVKGEPRPSSGRFTFATWDYFNPKSPLLPSGLLGPVTMVTTENSAR